MNDVRIAAKAAGVPVCVCVFGYAETAFVNQAPARSAPGLGPSGFNPHAFARSGLRAPLAFDTDEVAR